MHTHRPTHSRLLRTLISPLAVLAAAAAFGCHDGSDSPVTPAEVLLGAHPNNSSSFEALVEFDAASGAARRLTGMGTRGSNQIHAIAWNETRGVVQCIDFPLNMLGWLDPASGHVEHERPTPGVSYRDIAVRDGVVYGFDIGKDALVRLDVDAPPTVFPTHGFANLQSIAYHAGRDRFFGCDNQTDQLVEIDPLTGAGVAVGPLNILGSPNVVAAFESHDGETLYAVSGPVIFALDLDTGATTLIGALGEDLLGATCLPSGVFIGTSDLIGDTSDGLALVEFELPSMVTRPGVGLGARSIDHVALSPFGNAVIGADSVTDRTRTWTLSDGRAADLGPTVFTPRTLTRGTNGIDVIGTAGNVIGELDLQTGLFVRLDTVDFVGITGTNGANAICAGFVPGTAFVAANDWLLTLDFAAGVVVSAFDTGIPGLNGIDREPGTTKLRGIDGTGRTHLLDPIDESFVSDEQFFPSSIGISSLTHVPWTNDWLAVSSSTDQLLRRRPDGSVEGVGCFGLGLIDGLATDFDADVVYAVTGQGSTNRLLVRIEKGLRTTVVSPATPMSLPGFLGDIAYVATRGRLYGATYTTPPQLFEIDPVVGTATSLGALSRRLIVGESDGTLLYGIDTDTDELVTLDIDSLVITPIGPLSHEAKGLAFVPSSGELRSIDPTSATFVRIDPITGASTAIAPAEYLSWALTCQPW